MNQGNPKQNSIPNAIYTKAQLQAFLKADPHNVISFVITRNPTAAYKFIAHNFSGFPRLISGGEVTGAVMTAMEKFLDKQYAANPNKPEFIVHLMASMPAKAQLRNWTTPQN